MLRVAHTGMTGKLDRSAGALYHLLQAVTGLTNDQRVVLWRYVHRDVYYHRLATTNNTYLLYYVPTDTQRLRYIY